MPTATFIEPGSDATADLRFYTSIPPTGSGTIISDTSQAKDGPRSIKSTAAAANDEAQIAGVSLLVDDGGAVSLWVRLSSVAPSVATGFFAAASASTTLLRAGIDTTGKIRIDGRNATSKLGTTVLVADTWYRLTFTWVITTTTNWSFKCYLNGVLEVTTGNADGTLAGITLRDFYIGIGTFGGTGSPWTATSILTVWFDSLYVDDRTDQTDPGEIHVTAKRPFANGTTNGFTTQIGAGGSGYGSGHAPQVNERPLDIANGWSMVGAGAAITEEYNVESRSAGDVNLTNLTIKAVEGWVAAAALINETGQIIVDGTSSNIALILSPFLFVAQSVTPTSFPAGTGADIGIITSATVTTVSLYECGIIVAYLPASTVSFNLIRP
jgi:hypothetical protein